MHSPSYDWGDVSSDYPSGDPSGLLSDSQIYYYINPSHDMLDELSIK